MSTQTETSLQHARATAPPELSIVIPCLDEAPTIGGVVRAARESIGRLGVPAEIVVADNGSTDGSQSIAEEEGARVVSVAERGYGSALAAGIAAARGRSVIMGDADGSYDLSRLEPFVEQLRSGYDLVVGNRFQGGIAAGAMPWLHRHIGNPVLSLIGRRFFGTPCGDIYCGLRAFDRRKILELDVRSRGMEFAIEMVVKATMQNLRVTEVPTTLASDAEGREPHLRTWRDGWRSIRLMLLYSPRWLFLYPGALLVLAGLAGMILLTPRQRTVGAVHFDVSTLLYAGLAVVVGLQAIYFFVTAQWFGIAEGLLPDNPRLRRMLGTVTLEVAILAGVLVVAVGGALSIYAFGTWSRTGFGDLNYPHTLRIVIPGATLITCGIQTILSALFLSVLGLTRGRGSAGDRTHDDPSGQHERRSE
jgi:hypothetical protein